MTLGKGAVLSKSSGQNINTKSSSEAELVGVDDILPTILWPRYFIEAQGYDIEHNIIHQDNKSTLRMLINVKQSCTARSKHIKAIFFWLRTTTIERKLSLQNATPHKCGLVC